MIYVWKPLINPLSACPIDIRYPLCQNCACRWPSTVPGDARPSANAVLTTFYTCFLWSSNYLCWSDDVIQKARQDLEKSRGTSRLIHGISSANTPIVKYSRDILQAIPEMSISGKTFSLFVVFDIQWISEENARNSCFLLAKQTPLSAREPAAAVVSNIKGIVWLIDAIRCRRSGSTSTQIIACRLFGTRPIPDQLILCYNQLYRR